jgi:hypothetical protein
VSRLTLEEGRPSHFDGKRLTILELHSFHERIQPWISIMGNPDDRVPLLVQARSPFLFHCILLVTNYYNTSTSDRAKEVYRGLTEIVNTLLSWQILAPDPAQTTTDLVRGMVLLLYYKPVQHNAMQARGITEPGRVVHLSKVNALSSMMLHGASFLLSFRRFRGFRCFPRIC